MDEILDTSGFYKFDGEQWFFAINYVYNKNYELTRDGNRETTDGWQWYDEAPQEYLSWIEEQNNLLDNPGI